MASSTHDVNATMQRFVYNPHGVCVTMRRWACMTCARMLECVHALRSRALRRVSYTVSSRASLDEALTAFALLPQLRQLEVVVRNFTLSAEQLRNLGQCALCWGSRRLLHVARVCCFELFMACSRCFPLLCNYAYGPSCMCPCPLVTTMTTLLLQPRGQ